MLKNVFCLLFIAAIPVAGRAQALEARPLSSEAASPIPDTSKRCRAVIRGERHVTYRLPPSSEPPGEGISFATNWSELRWGGWYGQQAVDDCRIRVDGFQTWHGKAAVRIEVQPNDDPLALHANSERAEMFSMQDSGGTEIREGSASGLQYYATSYYFPTTWEGQQLPWSAFAPADCSADDGNACNSWAFVWQFYGWGGLVAAQRVIGGPQRYMFNQIEFSDGGLLRLGKWTDFVFRVDWRKGAFAIWRRDEGERQFRLALEGTSPVPPGRRVYVKQGLYRGGRVGERTDVLWIGPTVRGATFSAVERQAFGTNDGRLDGRD
ncbi:heparin lyase I family protein [Bradyrhizobium centrolobii]|uniref:heparin lyase I family protein n=1 Tax=Bradyrhizobium centrolobii TaxID=1505087 RepID=UPI0013747B76|nr:heparin lyase I family protein [Bradyrhizobium centrolobii]